MIHKNLYLPQAVDCRLPDCDCSLKKLMLCDLPPLNIPGSGVENNVPKYTDTSVGSGGVNPLRSQNSSALPVINLSSGLSTVAAMAARKTALGSVEDGDGWVKSLGTEFSEEPTL